MADDKYLGSDDARQHLEDHGIKRSHSTLHKWAADGTLPASRYDGPRRQYSVDDLNQFVDRHFGQHGGAEMPKQDVDYGGAYKTFSDHLKKGADGAKRYSHLSDRGQNPSVSGLGKTKSFAGRADGGATPYTDSRHWRDGPAKGAHAEGDGFTQGGDDHMFGPQGAETNAGGVTGHKTKRAGTGRIVGVETGYGTPDGKGKVGVSAPSGPGVTGNLNGSKPRPR
jgi:hypothetical protein